MNYANHNINLVWILKFMQCRQLADIALNAPAIERVFYCLNSNFSGSIWATKFCSIKLGFPRARAYWSSGPHIRCACLSILGIPSRARTDPLWVGVRHCLIPPDSLARTYWSNLHHWWKLRIIGFPRARTAPEIPINLQCLGILNFRLPRFFWLVFAPAIELLRII